MAKRSEFAQKLLDDLRLRKERMAVSQSSKGSKSAAPDVYANSKQTHRGSMEMKTHKSNGIRSGSAHNKTSGSNRTLSRGEASTEIVPYGKGRSSKQIGDLSMALAFALENGGKLRRMDSSGNSSMLGFLHQIGRRSVEVGRMERSGIDRHDTSSNRFPTLSHIHIKEISKGAQKLHQILRACSNGLNFESYSIEIGKELLKGAMDLEESLRMLVNLQEASEYMITPQSKTRITLLDEDDDDDEDNFVRAAEHKQLALPRFSFDKPSRNSHHIQEVARTDLRQRLMALTYSSEATNFNHDKHILRTSNSASHKKSSSHGSTSKTSAALSEQKNQSSSSKSKPEKVRIPNVIAKLMGLEEVPENADSKHAKKESSPKQKTERNVTNKSAEGSTTRERGTKDAENSVFTVRKQKQMQPNQIKMLQDPKNALQAEKNLPNHHASFEMTMHDGKPPKKEVEGMKSERGSNKANVKMDRHQSNNIQTSQSTGKRKTVQDNTKTREQKGKERGETRELIRKPELHQMASLAQNGAGSALTMQWQIEHNASILETEKRDENRYIYNDQPKSSNDTGFRQPQTFQNFEQEDTKHHAGEREWQIARQKIQDRTQKASTEVMSKNTTAPMNDIVNSQKRHSQTNQATPSSRSSKESVDGVPSKGFPTGRQHEDLVYGISSNNIQASLKDSKTMNSNQHCSPIDLKHDMMKKISNPTMQEKQAHPPATQNVMNTKGLKAKTPRRIDELVTRKSGTPHSLARPQKHQTSTSQEGKQKRREKLGGKVEQVRAIRSREAEARIVKSSKSMEIIQQSDVLEDLHSKVEQASNYYSPVEDKSQILKGPNILVQTDSCQSTVSTVTNEQQGQKLGRDQQQSHNFVLDSLNGTRQNSKDIAEPSKMEKQKASKLVAPEPLSESENHLKLILIRSQLFLNTVEALFKLDIPLGILRTGSEEYHDEESKLILDCGYEIMKRKGKKEELSVHPLMEISTTCVKVKSLDKLIKELHKDLEKLKFYGRNGNAECLVEDYLPKMVECDVYSWDLDVNCMWDFGWDKMFGFLEKDDIVRDVEKSMLNGLLDEVTRDLLPVF